MQKNDVIGIAGVFLLTFCLIALYHFMSAFGRHHKRRNVHIERARDSYVVSATAARVRSQQG